MKDSDLNTYERRNMAKLKIVKWGCVIQDSATLNRLAKLGYILRPDKKHIYIDNTDGWPTRMPFEVNGVFYSSRYVDGVFFPFLYQVEVRL